MKVEFGSNIGMYKSNNQQLGVNKTTKPQETRKTDIAEFSHSATALDKTLAVAKGPIVNGVTQTAEPTRIEALKQSVREGSYRISTDDLVKAILSE